LFGDENGAGEDMDGLDRMRNVFLGVVLVLVWIVGKGGDAEVLDFNKSAMNVLCCVKRLTSCCNITMRTSLQNKLHETMSE